MKKDMQRLIDKNLKLIIALTILLFATALLGRVAMAQVTEEWVARYNGPADSDDLARTLAVDGQGNVYVTGQSEGSGTSRDYATIKYDTNGNQLWIARYNGPADSYDRASALAVDAVGNVYVTGYSEEVGSSRDYATVKYDANGNEEWVARYKGQVDYYGIAPVLAVDAQGNVYVTGNTEGFGTSIDYDYITIKYDANGNQLWIARYNGPADSYSYDTAWALAVDAQGNVYVTGYSAGTGTGYDYATVKYDTDGNQLWVARYNGPANSADIAWALAVDAQGNVYVTGNSVGSGTPLDYDYATVKYDTDGNELWVARYNGPADSDDIAYTLAVDAQGNVYVTGYSAGIGTSSDYTTIKYDTDGNELWVARYNGPADSYDAAGRILAVDAQGNVYVTGYSTGVDTFWDYATIKYDSNGNEAWVVRYAGPEDSHDAAPAVALDAQGNVYVTGYSTGTGTTFDYVTIKYSQELENRPPVAGCQDVTVSADADCEASASIDNGSFDPDGDPITITQDPPGPYGLGNTLVTLTVEDDSGAPDSCAATVTVVDTIAPTIQSNAPATITPPDTPIVFTATAEDNCSVTVEIAEFDCFKFTKKGKRVDKTGSCMVSVNGDTITIEDSGGVGDHITWTVVATDSSGNTTTQTYEIQVVNPGKGKGKK